LGHTFNIQYSKHNIVIVAFLTCTVISNFSKVNFIFSQITGF